MRQMLDKDFDQFFKSSFEDFEVQPSAKSWDSIKKQISGKPIAKKYPFFWMAAASVVVILGLSIQLYTRPDAVIKLRPDNKDEVVQDLALGEKATDQVSRDIDVDRVAPTRVRKSTSPRKIIASVVEDGSILSEDNVKKDLGAVENIRIVENVVPVKSKLIAYESLNEEQMVRSPKLTKSVATSFRKEREMTLSLEGNTGKKLSIASVGDLVNRVVAAVDKREEKIIRISRTAESDNEVTGINLGVFRFSKEE